MKAFDDLYLEIEQEAKKDNSKKFFIDIVRGKERPVVLYGAGGNCEFAMSTCFGCNILVDAVCDSKATGIYSYKEKFYEIISPEQLLENYRNAFVLITSWNYEQEIYNFLCTLGFPNEQICFFRSPYMISSAIFRKKYLEGYRWAYNFFTDERSKKNIINRVREMILGLPCPADSLYKDGYFGFPDIKLQNGEVYVDGGAYIGDSAEEFIQDMKNAEKQYKHIYSFEPDSENFTKARKRLSLYSDITIIPKGLWSSEKELSFQSQQENGGGGASHITEKESENTVYIPVTAIDTIFSGQPEDMLPTIIKMDIEGAEREALIGAAGVIQKKKPQLIICAYHKPEDIYELVQTIINIREDYDFTLWKIGEGFYDLVLYAI